MKGKMFIILTVLLIISYFLYEHGNNNKNKKLEDGPEKYITGVITDTEGKPIPKVMVYLLGADIKSGTNSDGEYKIKAVIGDELIITHPLYKKRAIEIKNRAENITLYKTNEDNLKDKIKEDFPNMEVQ